MIDMLYKNKKQATLTKQFIEENREILKNQKKEKEKRTCQSLK